LLGPSINGTSWSGENEWFEFPLVPDEAFQVHHDTCTPAEGRLPYCSSPSQVEAHVSKRSQKKTDMEIEEADLGDEASDHKTEDDGVNKKQRRSREKPAADAKDTASSASTVRVCDCFLCV